MFRGTETPMSLDEDFFIQRPEEKKLKTRRSLQIRKKPKMTPKRRVVESDDDDEEFKTDWFRDLPGVLMEYLQLFWNVSLVVGVMVMLIQVYVSVSYDVNVSHEKVSSGHVAAIESCRMQFNENKCESPMPALKQKCLEWKRCSEMDPDKFPRAPVNANALAEIIENFITRLSVKSLTFITILVCLLLIINVYFVRTKKREDYYPMYMSPLPPPRPRRQRRSQFTLSPCLRVK